MVNCTKSMLFSTEMVQALLEGRKSVTRRHPFQMPEDYNMLKGLYRNDNGRLCALFQCQSDPTTEAVYCRYDQGVILWVREPWQFIPCSDCQMKQKGICSEKPTTYRSRNFSGEGCFVYRADYPERGSIKWRPSIHMPREAARIFLRVTEVHVERLRDITEQGAEKEGVVKIRDHEYMGLNRSFYSPVAAFHNLWDGLIDLFNLSRYGWEANPWVWVISFERIDKPTDWGCTKS